MDIFVPYLVTTLFSLVCMRPLLVEPLPPSKWIGHRPPTLSECIYLKSPPVCVGIYYGWPLTRSWETCVCLSGGKKYKFHTKRLVDIRDDSLRYGSFPEISAWIFYRSNHSKLFWKISQSNFYKYLKLETELHHGLFPVIFTNFFMGYFLEHMWTAASETLSNFHDFSQVSIILNLI